MNIFFWVIAILLIAFGLFMNYTNWKVWLASRKAKEQFCQNHKDAKIIVLGKYRPWLFLLLTAACIVFGCIILFASSNLPADSRYSQGMVYLGLAIFGIAMFAEALTDSRVASGPDGFMFESEYIRYKNIRTVQVGKGFFKGSMLMMNGTKEVPVNKTLAKWTEEQLAAWQKNRKEQRRGRYGRGRNNAKKEN